MEEQGGIKWVHLDGEHWRGDAPCGRMYGIDRLWAEPNPFYLYSGWHDYIPFASTEDAKKAAEDHYAATKNEEPPWRIETAP